MQNTMVRGGGRSAGEKNKNRSWGKNWKRGMKREENYIKKGRKGLKNASFWAINSKPLTLDLWPLWYYRYYRCKILAEQRSTVDVRFLDVGGMERLVLFFSINLFPFAQFNCWYSLYYFLFFSCILVFLP